MTDSESAPTFEEALRRLEQIVDRLEAGDLDLEESLRLFERGVALARLCARRLDEAERKIELLLEEDGDVIVRIAPDFELDEESADDKDAGDASA